MNHVSLPGQKHFHSCGTGTGPSAGRDTETIGGGHMEFLRTHQLTIMLFFSGTCGVLAILALMIRSLPARRKKILSVFEASVMMLLLSDRYAYLFRGNTSRLGW